MQRRAAAPCTRANDQYGGCLIHEWESDVVDSTKLYVQNVISGDRDPARARRFDGFRVPPGVQITSD